MKQVKQTPVQFVEGYLVLQTRTAYNSMIQMSKVYKMIFKIATIIEMIKI